MPFVDFECATGVAENGIVFVLPLYSGFAYGRRAALSFFKYTPAELNPVCIVLDDASPNYDEQDWDAWYDGLPRERCTHLHYPVNAGLTRSWNAGLTLARQYGAKYAAAGNSDLVFTEGWYEGLLHHLDKGVSLVGPVTNTPGRTKQKGPTQNILDFIPDYVVDDSAVALTAAARRLRTQQPLETIHYDDINGFFTMAKVESWWSGAFNDNHVFDPSKKMAGNEDELERRWKRLGRKIGFVPSSFVFHYRSVSRGDKFLTPGWSRLDDMHKPV